MLKSRLLRYTKAIVYLEISVIAHEQTINCRQLFTVLSTNQNDEEIMINYSLRFKR